MIKKPDDKTTRLVKGRNGERDGEKRHKSRK